LLAKYGGPRGGALPCTEVGSPSAVSSRSKLLPLVTRDFSFIRALQLAQLGPAADVVEQPLLLRDALVRYVSERGLPV
jgi:hypothetical protein